MALNVEMAGDEEFYEKRWCTYEDFERDFKQYCVESKQVFSIISSRAVEKRNAKLSQGELTCYRYY